MTEIPQQQFTFDVGGAEPDEGILKVGGALHVHRELNKGEEVHVQIVDADGVAVADGYGRVVGIAFRDTIDEHGNVTSTTRIHSIRAT